MAGEQGSSQAVVLGGGEVGGAERGGGWEVGRPKAKGPLES